MRSVVFLAIFGTVLSACSSVKPVETRRSGFFDRLSELEPAGRVRYSSVDDEEEEDQKPTRKVAHLENVSLRWPLARVTVTSPFGQRGHEFHEGIDLRASSGTPVLAAQNGRVLYAEKRIRGYGKMVVISHPGGFATVYAHNSKLLVRRGQRVQKGQQIALSGRTGKARGPHLHFEVRKGTSPVDPIEVLPQSAHARLRKTKMAAASYVAQSE